MKYLFKVLYNNGDVYEQNEDDVSVTDPKKSCYFDVKQDQVKAFALCGKGHTYLVDLKDGHFEIDGIPFVMHEENDLLKDFRLIYWRRHTHSFNQRIDAHSQPEEIAHNIVFRFGWQATNPKGQNIQEVMQIN